MSLHVTKHEVANEMCLMGDAFIHQLGHAWYAADDDNRYLIETMWAREWREHAANVQKRKEAKNGTQH